MRRLLVCRFVRPREARKVIKQLSSTAITTLLQLPSKSGETRSQTSKKMSPVSGHEVAPALPLPKGVG
jgi:hypothetical protein